jgi:hypothetical protein
MGSEVSADPMFLIFMSIDALKLILAGLILASSTGLYSLDKVCDVSWSLSTFYRGLNGSTAVMAKNYHQRHTQMLGSILDASQCSVVQDLPGSPDHENVAYALIKDYLWGDPGVRTAHNDGKGVLTGDDLSAALCRLIGVFDVA